MSSCRSASQPASQSVGPPRNESAERSCSTSLDLVNNQHNERALQGLLREEKEGEEEVEREAVEVEGKKKISPGGWKSAAVTLIKNLPARPSSGSFPRTSRKLSGCLPSVSPHTCAALLMLIRRSMCPIVAHGAHRGGNPGRLRPRSHSFFSPSFFSFFPFFPPPVRSEVRSGDSAVTALECDSADGPSDR